MEANTPLDRAQTEQYALVKYSELRDFTDRRLLEHARETSEAAGKLLTDQLTRNWGACPPPAIVDQIEQVKHAGLLYAVMDHCAATFEDVCQVADLEVAKILSEFSMDPRLPEPIRVLERIGRLAIGGIASQVLMLADVLCTVRYYEKWLDEPQDAELVALVIRDLETRRKLLSPLRHVTDSKPLNSWLRRGYSLIDTLTTRCTGLVRQANMEKQIIKRKARAAAGATTVCRKPKI